MELNSVNFVKTISFNEQKRVNKVSDIMMFYFYLMISLMSTFSDEIYLAMTKAGIRVVQVNAKYLTSFVNNKGIINFVEQLKKLRFILSDDSGVELIMSHNGEGHESYSDFVIKKVRYAGMEFTIDKEKVIAFGEHFQKLFQNTYGELGELFTCVSEQVPGDEKLKNTFLMKCRLKNALIPVLTYVSKEVNVANSSVCIDISNLRRLNQVSLNGKSYTLAVLNNIEFLQIVDIKEAYENNIIFATEVCFGSLNNNAGPFLMTMNGTLYTQEEDNLRPLKVCWS